MRMGNTFSRALDPSKPLLFGDHPLGILQEEVWHPSAARLSWQNPLSGTTSDLTFDRSSPSCEADSHNPRKQAMTDHLGVWVFSSCMRVYCDHIISILCCTKTVGMYSTHCSQIVSTLGFFSGCVAWYQCNGQPIKLHLSAKLGKVMGLLAAICRR